MTAATAKRATTTPEQPATEPTAQPLLDLTRLLLAIKRRRRFWLSLALVGLIAGASLAVLIPSPPSAVVQILVVHEDDQPSDSGNLIRTDVALLETAKVAGEALEKVGARQRPEDFLKDYDVLGVTNNVLQVTVRAKTSADAVKRAQALADVFIADHVNRIKAGADAEAKALVDQRDRVQAELKQVNTQISTAETKQQQADQNGGEGAQGQQNAAGLDSLYARRAELTSRVSDLSQQAEEAGIGAPRVEAGTQIVDAPRALKVSHLSTLVTNSAIGLLLGLIIGWVLAGITGVVRDRPVLRKDIAANLGASVIAQLSVPRRGPARLWRAKRATRERRRVAGTLVRLVRGGSGPVSVLELGSGRVAAALTLDVATELAADRDVVIVEDPAGRVVADDLPGRDLDELTGRADRPIRIIGAEETAPGRPGETRIGIGSVTPGTAWTDLRHLGAETLLVVRTGFADTAWLHTVARQLADCQIPIVGVVLVDPDPRDKSDGTLWDGLHTALRGHGLSPAAIEARTDASRTVEASAEEVPRLIPASATRIPASASAPGRIPAAATWRPGQPTRAPFARPIAASGQPGSANGPVGQPTADRSTRPVATFRQPSLANGPVEQPIPDRSARPIAGTGQPGSANGPVGQPTPDRSARPIAGTGQSGSANGLRPVEQSTADRSTRPTAGSGQPGSANGPTRAGQPTADRSARPITAPGQPRAANGPVEQSTGDRSARPVAASGQPGSANGAVGQATPEPAKESGRPDRAAAAEAGPGKRPESAAQSERDEKKRDEHPERTEQRDRAQQPERGDQRNQDDQRNRDEQAERGEPERGEQSERSEQRDRDEQRDRGEQRDRDEQAERDEQRDRGEKPREQADKADERGDKKRGEEGKRRPSWVPEPIAKGEPTAKAEPRPHPERKPSWVPEPVAKPNPSAEQPAKSGEPAEHDDRTPMPVHYPAPVPANGVNGRNGNADLPTKRFPPVQPHLKNGPGDDVHDLPTKRFAPVQPDRGPKS